MTASEASRLDFRAGDCPRLLISQAQPRQGWTGDASAQVPKYRHKRHLRKCETLRIKAAKHWSASIFCRPKMRPNFATSTKHWRCVQMFHVEHFLEQAFPNPQPEPAPSEKNAPRGAFPSLASSLSPKEKGRPGGIPRPAFSFSAPTFSSSALASSTRAPP